MGEVIPIEQARAAVRVGRKCTPLRKSGDETSVLRKMKDYEQWLKDYTKKK